jgi:hypothetical protein
VLASIAVRLCVIHVRVVAVWKEAIFQAAAMIGGVVLARAVQDHRLSDEILKRVRQKLG